MTLFDYADARAKALDGMQRAVDHADAGNPHAISTELCYGMGRAEAALPTPVPGSNQTAVSKGHATWL